MRQTLRLVGPDAAPQWRLMAGGTAVLLAEVVFRVLEPWPLKVTIDSLVAALGRHTGSAPATVSSLVGLGIALLAIVAGRAVCNYLATVAFALVGSRTAASLRSRAFHHVQGLSQQFHARNRSADTVQRLIADVNRMQEVAVTAGLPMAANTLTLLVMVVVMVFLDPLLAMIVLLAVVAFLLASSGNSRRISAASLSSRIRHASGAPRTRSSSARTTRYSISTTSLRSFGAKLIAPCESLLRILASAASILIFGFFCSSRNCLMSALLSSFSLTPEGRVSKIVISLLSRVTNGLDIMFSFRNL